MPEDQIFTENALTVINKRYLLRDPETGEALETPEGMLMRVAKHVASAELGLYETGVSKQAEYTDRFFRMMRDLVFLPNTPCLVNAGKGQKDSGLSACFVLPIEDDMTQIYKTLGDAATVIKSGGGVGYSFSKLRPKGDRVATTGGVAGGPVAFMGLFHSSAQQVKQGGVRPAAQMAILRCDHPDILDFIHAKEQDKSLSTFNISVGITDAFMEAVRCDGEFGLVNPRTGEVVRMIHARQIWDEIVDFAWKTGDPGLFFLDEANKSNPTPVFGDYEATNPCGEVVLLPGEPCNLGSVVLSKFVWRLGDTQLKSSSQIEEASAAIDWDRLGDTVDTAIRFLDDVIDVNAYPVPLIEKMALGNRKIGLGVMGWADMLILLNIPYGSELSFALAEKVMKFIHDRSYQYDERLAQERGCFPNWEDSLYCGATERWGYHRRQRNSTKLTIAPTGSISLLANCSSGIEPHFALAYTRLAINATETLHFFNEDLKPYMQAIFSDDDYSLVAAELARVGSLERLSDRWKDMINSAMPNLFGRFKVAYDISPADHVRMQAAFQKWVDSSISKTVNLPKEATKQDVADVYVQAWTSKCKGVTVYRDGSRSDQVLSTGDSRAAEAGFADGVSKMAQAAIALVGPRPRKHAMKGTSRFINTGCGDLLLTVNYDEHGIAEVIAKGGKSGGCVSAQLEAIGRLTSLALRSGVPKEKIIAQLGGISCHLPAFYNSTVGDTKTVKSCGDAISIGMIEAVAEMENELVVREAEISHQGSCPSCGGSIKRESGCTSCVNPSCGWSRC